MAKVRVQGWVDRALADRVGSWAQARERSVSWAVEQALTRLVDDRSLAEVEDDDLVVEAIPGDNQEVHKGLRGVRLTHPSGLVVEATSEPSGLANRALALQRLRDKLAEDSPARPDPTGRERPHRHRFTTRVPGSEHYVQGRPWAKFRCACGTEKDQQVP